MNRLQKILISISILAIFVIVISLFASEVLLPNQKTPVRKLIPISLDSAKEKEVPITGGDTVAAWIWQYPTEIKNFDSMIKFSSQEGINTLYIYIDEYIDIYEMPKGSERDQKMEKYLSALKTIIKKAKSAGIKIHALSGNTNYSYDSHSYIPPLIIDHVFNFNKQNPDTKLEGIQFDIEYYDDPRYFNNPEENTKSFLTLVSNLSEQTKKLNDQNNEKVSLGFDIPFWFDHPNDYLNKSIFTEVLKSVSVTQNSYLVIMAYRNVVEGSGGVLEISNDELNQGDATTVKIIIAQEIKENKDRKITYFGKSRKEIKSSFQKIIDAEKSHPSFEGISIHDLNALMQTL